MIEALFDDSPCKVEKSPKSFDGAVVLIEALFDDSPCKVEKSPNSFDGAIVLIEDLFDESPGKSLNPPKSLLSVIVSSTVSNGGGSLDTILANCEKLLLDDSGLNFVLVVGLIAESSANLAPKTSSLAAFSSAVCFSSVLFDPVISILVKSNIEEGNVVMFEGSILSSKMNLEDVFFTCLAVV